MVFICFRQFWRYRYAVGFGGELHYRWGDVYLHSDLGTGKLNAWVKRADCGFRKYVLLGFECAEQGVAGKFRVDSKSDFPVRNEYQAGRRRQGTFYENLGGDVIFAINEGEVFIVITIVNRIMIL